MKPVYDRHGVRVFHGDCLDVLAQLDDASVDSVVTDPPYSLSFMQRDWDSHDTSADFQAWCIVWARECLRVLKPGGHLVAFGGTRTFHRLTCGIEDAGFEIRDGIGSPVMAWVQGAGFPKSKDVSKDERFCRCEPGPAVPYDHGDSHLRRVREDIPNARSVAQTSEVPDLLPPVQREGSGPGLGDIRPQGTVRLDPGDRSVVPGEDFWGTEPGLERRGDVQASEGQLRRPEVRPLPSGPDGDGAFGRLRDGTPAGDGSLDRAPADAHRVREPHRSESAEQRADESRTVADERGPQAWRGWPVCAGCGKPRVPAGLGTGLKPSWEPIILARKPLSGTVAGNVLTHGTGALNIAGTRVADASTKTGGGWAAHKREHSDGWDRPYVKGVESTVPSGQGRWPANVVLLHAITCTVDPVWCDPSCPVAELDRQSGVLTSGRLDRSRITADNAIYGQAPQVRTGTYEPDAGGASRFFPVFRWEAKAPTSERPMVNGRAHPTVKPIALMRWLVRLITPPGGVVLDPFAGTGTTGQAARAEGMRALLIDADPEAIGWIKARLDARPRQTETTAASLPDEPLDLLDLLAQEDVS